MSSALLCTLYSPLCTNSGSGKKNAYLVDCDYLSTILVSYYTWLYSFVKCDKQNITRKLNPEYLWFFRFLVFRFSLWIWFDYGQILLYADSAWSCVGNDMPCLLLTSHFSWFQRRASGDVKYRYLPVSPVLSGNLIYDIVLKSLKWRFF